MVSPWNQRCHLISLTMLTQLRYTESNARCNDYLGFNLPFAMVQTNFDCERARMTCWLCTFWSRLLTFLPIRFCSWTRTISSKRRSRLLTSKTSSRYVNCSCSKSCLTGSGLILPCLRIMRASPAMPYKAVIILDHDSPSSRANPVRPGNEKSMFSMYPQQIFGIGCLPNQPIFDFCVAKRTFVFEALRTQLIRPYYELSWQLSKVRGLPSLSQSAMIPDARLFFLLLLLTCSLYRVSPISFPSSFLRFQPWLNCTFFNISSVLSYSRKNSIALRGNLTKAALI